jgi:Flp pilus assembly protein TadG
MSVLARIRRRAKRSKANRLARDESGATMIEFGVLAVPFFAIIGATLETALVFLATQVLDSAVHDASRLIRTGQAQSAEFTLPDFRAAVCDHVFGLIDCDQMKIKVHTIDTFADVTYEAPVDEDGDWTIIEDYNDGIASSIIFVEVYYKWPTLLNIFGFDLADQPDGTRLLGASRVFKNEPF